MQFIVDDNGTVLDAYRCHIITLSESEAEAFMNDLSDLERAADAAFYGAYIPDVI